MKLILSEEGEDLNEGLIRQLLQEDKIYVTEIYYDKFSRMFWKNVPMLKYLCHEAVYRNREKLRGDIPLLPNILRNSIEDYIKTEEARIVYNNS